MNAVTKTETGGIAAALASAQQAMGPALKNAKNPHLKSKYADLASVMDACLPALNAAGIAVIQPTGSEEGERFVDTVLIHGATGEELRCRVPLIIGKNDMQGYGSAVTYARRYGLMSMAGIAPEDDDGNEAAKNAPPKQDEKRNDAPPHEAIRDKMKDALSKAATTDDLAAIWGDERFRADLKALPAPMKAEIEKAKNDAKDRLSQEPEDAEIPY